MALSYSQNNMTASSSYNDGRKARQAKVAKEDNPNPNNSVFAFYWAQGWEDEDTLIRDMMNIVKRFHAGNGSIE